MVSNNKKHSAPLCGAFYLCNLYRLLQNHFSSIGKNSFSFLVQKIFFKKVTYYLLFFYLCYYLYINSIAYEKTI